MIRFFITAVLFSLLVSGCGLKADLRLPPAPPPPSTVPTPPGAQP